MPYIHVYDLAIIKYSISHTRHGSSTPLVIPGAVARLSTITCCGLTSTPTSGAFFREDLAMKIFLWPLIQEEHLSVNGKRMHTKYWLTASGRLAQEQCG